MGFECDRFPFAFKSGVISSASSHKQFEQTFFKTLDACCDLFISNIFPQQTLKDSTQINLDDCFIPSDETFTRKQLPHICPLLNSVLFATNNHNNSAKLRYILEYCVYLGLKRVAIRLDSTYLDSIIQELLKVSKILEGARIGLIVVVPVGGSASADLPWKSYIQLRQQLGSRISLELCLQVDSGDIANLMLDRWMGESITYVSFTHNDFIVNQKGYPVLPNQYEQFLKKCFLSQIHIFISITSNHRPKISQFEYFTHILNNLSQKLTDYDLTVQQLVDHLQTPLQPYRDNLQAQIYDIFEKDAHKYDEYELSFIEALQGFSQTKTVACYYVGSGKGMILEKIIRAAKKARRRIKVYCIQKNPFPIQTLKRRIAKNKWSKFVEVVQSDIKEYIMPQHPDIVFSELLGGLGDNQLSPECLRWAEQQCTEKTIFVPQQYRSFIRPVSAHQIYKQLSPKEKEQYFTVYLTKYYSPFKSQQIWEFVHPLSKQDNLTRKISLQWQVKHAVLINGFQGTFDCNLFGKAYFSIVPENKDKNFYSWFSLFFPFMEEQLLKSGQSLGVDMTRSSSESKVWYEWRYWIKDIQGKIRKDGRWQNSKGGFAMFLSQGQ